MRIDIKQVQKQIKKITKAAETLMKTGRAGIAGRVRMHKPMTLDKNDPKVKECAQLLYMIEWKKLTREWVYSHYPYCVDIIETLETMKNVEDEVE